MNRLHGVSGPRAAPELDGEPRVFVSQTLTGRVRLDGASFRNCQFRQATLLYAGIAGVELTGCSFDEARIEFDGPAANALAFLKAMSSPGSGLSQVVRASFPQIFGH